MKKSEKLLEAIGAIDERHLPDPNEIFDIQSGEDVGEEAEMRFSGDYQGKRLPFRAALIPALLTAAAVAVGVALKYYPILTEPEYTFETAETTSSLTKENVPATPSGTTAGTLFEGTELAPLDLIGCYIDEEGHYRIDIYNWQKSDDFDLYRKYFFGTWENNLGVFGKYIPLYVIDDSEKAFLINNRGWRFTGFYKISENVLAFAINDNAEVEIFWMDINYPDIMYADDLNGGHDDIENWKPNILTKTDSPINEPEENFLSIYKLYEMSRDYGIDFDMLVDIEYDTDIYIGDDSYFVTHDGMVWAKLLHDDWYQFYPVYLVSEAPDRLEFKTRIGNIMYDNSEIDAEYTIVKINGKWSRNVKLTLSDGSTVTLSDDDAPHPNETDLSALELLDYYIDEEGHYRANDADWKLSDDYDLFRKYFFGEWEGSFAFADDSSKQERMIIDDSLKSYNMTESGIFFSTYYEVNSHVLAFITGGIEGSSIQWIDTDHPDTMYMVWGGLGENNWLWSRDDNGRMSSPKVYTLTKTDALPNEPEDGFLSIFRLREISRDYGIDIDMLLDIEYETNIYIGDDPDFVTQNGMVWAFLAHNQSFQFYPVYLVSEAPNKLEFKTRIGNGMYKRPEDFEADAEYTLEKTSGGWKRTVILTLHDGSTVTLSDDIAPFPKETALSVLELLDYYIDDQGHYQAGVDQWKASENYNLFRKYFFGTWESGFSYDKFDGKQKRIVIDDSEQSTVVTDNDIWFSGMFYETKDNVLVFINGGVAGATMYCLDINAPDTMYVVLGGIGEHNFILSDNEGNPYVYSLIKTDKQPNEPTDGFLSIYRIYEMAYKYGIDIEMLTDIHYSEALGLVHDAHANFYPVYLVFEESDKIVLKTILWNYYYEDQSSAIDADCTIEKINGKWTRTVILTLPDGTTVHLETADTEKEQPDDQESETLTAETAAAA